MIQLKQCRIVSLLSKLNYNYRIVWEVSNRGLAVHRRSADQRVISSVVGHLDSSSFEVLPSETNQSRQVQFLDKCNISPETKNDVKNFLMISKK